jgi:prolyl-tRNA synthetase
MVGALIMTHSDDDGLVLPPKLAPKQIVILPIYRNDEEKSEVLIYCHSLKTELESKFYADVRLRVMIDDRDIRGGEKKWHHVKKGVPIRLEVGPRDVASNSVFLGRRDEAKSNGIDRAEFVSTVNQILDSIQNQLYQRALQLREENSRDIDSLDEFKQFFTPKNEQKPEIHGGFAQCHFVDCDETDAILKNLKVTIRCIPFQAEEIAGTCLFTGKPTNQRAIFAKSY